MTAAANTAKRAGKGHEKCESPRHDKGLRHGKKPLLSGYADGFQNRRQGHAGK